jgi:membrane associated rhomboid family serine protease/Tfp pilus assembly protein PilF
VDDDRTTVLEDRTSFLRGRRLVDDDRTTVLRDRTSLLEGHGRLVRVASRPLVCQIALVMADSDGIPPGALTIAQILEKRTPRAWVTPALAGLMGGGFVFEMSRGLSPLLPTSEQLYGVGALFGPAIIEGQWWRLLSSLLIHAGLLHIAFILWAFWSIGKFAERIFGNLAFLVIFVLSGLGGGLASLAVHPLAVSMGAAGSVFGVYGALLAFLVLHKGVLPDAFRSTMRNRLLGFLALNILLNLSLPSLDVSGTCGGLVTGLFAGAFLERDLLAPRALLARRLGGVLGIALALLGVAFGVKRRLAAVPEIAAQTYADQAFVRLKADDVPEAIDLYTKALDLHREAGWLVNRAIAYLGSDQPKLAQADLVEASEIDGHPDVRLLMCEADVHVAKTKAELDKAETRCTDALTHEPRSVEVLALRAEARTLAEKYDLALADAEMALTIEPSSPVAHRARLAVLVDSKRATEDAAEQDCRSLLADKAPVSSDYALCAHVSEARGDKETMDQRLDAALRKNAKSPAALLLRASRRDEQGHAAESRADLEALVAAAPGVATAWNNLAWVKVEMGDYASALKDADRAVALEPDSAAFLGTRCFARAGTGDTKGALEDCARVMQLQPKSLIDQGMLAFLEHRYDDARSTWAKAKDEDPVNAKALGPFLAKLP